MDPADCDLKWREFFATFGIDSFASLVPKAAVRPQILMPRQNELPREISLRIAAIRETFEECGVLVCRRKEDAPSAWARHVSGERNYEKPANFRYINYIGGDNHAGRVIFSS